MFVLLGMSSLMLTVQSCDDGETYAEMKENEKDAIKRFIKDNELVGPINVISEAQFYEQDTMTDVSKNEFVLFHEDGIYMQIVRKGEGKTMVEMAKEQKDSTVAKELICRFLEYDIQNADTTYSDFLTESIYEKMMCRYEHRGRSYKASFTYGYMKQYYGDVVPEGWLKPLEYIRLSKNDSKTAKVRIIVPHSSGTSSASQYVLPFYYEISYQIPAGG